MGGGLCDTKIEKIPMGMGQCSESRLFVVAMDYITDLPSQGKTVILVVVDAFSKHFIPCKQIPVAKKLAILFMQHMVRLHSFPGKVVSDWRAQFVAGFGGNCCR